eukprot:GHRR01032753.1.p2 GENE.GHRR01032753.1~~GHRR01032753.1.p2  ORF type:complete len:117 (+),score=36.53 GHRR01032753.1:372-722(+)
MTVGAAVAEAQLGTGTNSCSMYRQGCTTVNGHASHPVDQGSCHAKSADHIPGTLTGSKKQRVFPDPVLAAPKMSLPASAWGSAARCMAVIVTYPASFSAALVYLLIGSSANVLEPA